MFQQPLAILFVLLGVITFSIHLVRRFPWAERLSPVIWIIFVSAMASNLGLIPKDVPLYGALIGFTVPFAVCVILFTVRLADVRLAGRPMLGAFLLAIVGTVLGVTAASVSLAPLLTGILPEGAWKLAGPYAGTYIGGSLNFFALWSGLDIGDQDLFAAANAVDNITFLPLYLCWMIIPTMIGTRYVTSERWAVKSNEAAGNPATEETAPFDVGAIAALFFLAVAVMAASEWMKSAVVDRFAPALPTILLVTTLALLLGQLRPVRSLKGAWQLGDLAFYVFFAAVGATIDFYRAVVLSPVLFLYVTIVIVVHMTVLYGVGRRLKMDVGVLTMASVATKAGPALVVPVAEAKGWQHLVLPGIIAGMLGYALGNYVGLGVAYGVRALVGG